MDEGALKPIRITLPDGSVREHAPGASGAAIAAGIGDGLARAALAIAVDGELRDLARPIERDAAVEIVTAGSDDKIVLELLRHDCAHVMAQAVQEPFPGTQVTIGPAIEDGFYYDFARNEPFTPDDFPAIEARMHEIVDRDEPFEREVWDRAEAARLFRDKGEHYKAEIIDGIPGDEPITLYRQGAWIDLCRGPHLPSTAKLGHAFKLTNELHGASHIVGRISRGHPGRSRTIDGQEAIVLGARFVD